MQGVPGTLHSWFHKIGLVPNICIFVSGKKNVGYCFHSKKSYSHIMHTGKGYSRDMPTRHPHSKSETQTRCTFVSILLVRIRVKMFVNAPPLKYYSYFVQGQAARAVTAPHSYLEFWMQTTRHMPIVCICSPAILASIIFF